MQRSTKNYQDMLALVDQPYNWQYFQYLLGSNSNLMRLSWSQSSNAPAESGKSEYNIFALSVDFATHVSPFRLWKEFPFLATLSNHQYWAPHSRTWITKSAWNYFLVHVRVSFFTAKPRSLRKDCSKRLARWVKFNIPKTFFVRKFNGTLMCIELGCNDDDEFDAASLRDHCIKKHKRVAWSVSHCDFCMESNRLKTQGDIPMCHVKSAEKRGKWCFYLNIPLGYTLR